MAFSRIQILGLVRIVQEALLNIRKHARASQVSLTFSVEDGQPRLMIADDGQGFDTAEVAARSVDKGGAGLANMQSRAQALGGRLTVASSAARTSVTLTWPK